jgi:DNA-binding NtrC family response regulator
MDNIKIITYVLDDDRQELELLEPFLQRVCGCDLELYTDPEEFIHAIEQGVHIAIIDHRLSAKTDGIEVGKKVLNKNPLAFLILYSGTNNAKVWQQATNAGFQRLIDKNDPDCYVQVAELVSKAMPIIRFQIRQHNTLSHFKNKYGKYL